MAIVSEEQAKKDADEFASGFGDEWNQTDESDFVDGGGEAVGTPEAGSVVAEGEAPEQGAASEEMAAEPVADEPAPEMAAEGAASETPEPVPAEPSDEGAPVDQPEEGSATGEMNDVPPEDMQRFKSWEGRLKKREAELAAREAALQRKSGGEMESPAEEAAEGGQVELMISDGGGQADAEAATMSDHNEPTLAELLEEGRNDFGDRFILMVTKAAEEGARKIVEEMLGSKLGETEASVKALMDRIDAADQGEHMEYISDMHPDVADVVESDEFKQWIADKPEMQACCEHGTKRAVVKMLNKFKEARKEANNDEAIDDLVAVQSSGVVIPETKKGGDSFEAAWNEF
jgi:hypothetical protein